MKYESILTLANSLWYLEYEQRDVLSEKQWLEDYLKLTTNNQKMSIEPTFIESLKKLRTAIIDLFNEQGLDAHLNFLNALLKQTPSYQQIQIEEKQISLSNHSNSEKSNLVLQKIILELIVLIQSDALKSIKRCDNDDCQFYFLDSSKNQSKKYCSLKCNNVAKVRRYRANHLTK